MKFLDYKDLPKNTSTLPRLTNEDCITETLQVLKNADFGYFDLGSTRYFIHEGLKAQIVKKRYGYLVQDYVQYTNQVCRKAMRNLEELLQALEDAQIFKNWK